MKTLIYSLVAFATLFTSCSDEEAIVHLDYGTKSFEADLKYMPDTEHGGVAYTQQTYFAFGNDEAVATGTYGESNWTAFNLYTESDDYNVTTDVTDWDLAITYYIDPIDMGTMIYPYGVSGTLINTDNITGVAKIDYTESSELTVISEEFAGLDIDDTTGLTYESNIDIIYYSDWKTVDMETSLYTVHSNVFYILKHIDGSIYKLRFTGFHGDSSDERIAQFEYQLIEQ